MPRAALALASMAVLGFHAALHARSVKAQDHPNPVRGVRIASRIRCDGATNPQEDLKLEPTFSPGSAQRAFHLDLFESRYCRRLDLYFFCVVPGHRHWKHAWTASSQGPAAPPRYWMDSCAAWGTPDAPEYILSGWYRENPEAKDSPWKQAAIKKVSETPEIYEFTDAQGGAARLRIERK